MSNQERSENLEVLARRILDLGQTIGARSAKNGPTSLDGIRDFCSKEFSEAEDLIASMKAIGMAIELAEPEGANVPWSGGRGGRKPC